MMGCAIYYKKCQEVDTVATQALIEAPNTIEEDIIRAPHGARAYP
jgi:hypothetical protein